MASGQDLEASHASVKGVPKEIITADEISIPVYHFEGFRPVLSFFNDTTYVLNFWATWCKPCIEEIPNFTKVMEEMTGEKVEFIFVSLDFRRTLETGVIPFVKARQMTGNVVMLNDPSANDWIDQVDASWSGSIPATLVYRNERRVFSEKQLSYDELKSIIHSLNNP